MQKAMTETYGRTRDVWVVDAAIGTIALVGGLGSGIASWYHAKDTLVSLDFLPTYLWLAWSPKVVWSSIGFFSGGLILGAHLKAASPLRVLFWVAVWAVGWSVLLTSRSIALFFPTEPPVWAIVLIQVPVQSVLCVLAGLLGALVGRKLRNHTKKQEQQVGEAA